MENSNTIPNNKDFQKILLPKGFAGTGPNGSFFETPEWVDKNKPPGLTSQEKMYAPPGMYILKKTFFNLFIDLKNILLYLGWWIDLFNGKNIFFSPNLVWLAITLMVYFTFPYDFQAAKDLQNLDWVLYRSVKKFFNAAFTIDLLLYLFNKSFFKYFQIQN